MGQNQDQNQQAFHSETSETPHNTTNGEGVSAEVEQESNRAEENQENQSATEANQEEEVSNMTEGLHEETQEEAEKEEEDIEEEDFSQLSKKELLSRLKALAHDDNPLRVNRKVQDIKKYFEIYLDNEYRVTLQKFLDAGNSEVDFQPSPDPLKTEFFQVFNDFKKRRNAYIQRLNEEKEANLKAKRSILDQMKHVTENLETVKDGYNEFKRLQAEWRKIGHVPKKDLENLRRSYQFYVNKFYDNQSIYAEFKELDRKKNLESKEELCRRLEELAYNQDLSEIKKEIRKIEDEWHHIGPVPRNHSEAIGNHFSRAMAEVEKQKQALEEAIEREREKNLELKQQIVEKIQAMANFQSEKPRDWIQKNEQLENLIKEWRSIGFVPYDKKDEVARAFRESVRSFNYNKNQFFKRKKKERAENVKQKKAIIERVRELLEPEDFKAAKNEILDLQKQWKTIGSVPAKESEKLWKEFRGLCDEFFDKLGQHYKAKEEEEKQNLEKKNALCERIEKAASEGVENPEQAIREFEQEWQQIGFVPLKEKDRIRKRFDKALKRMVQQTDEESETSPEVINYRIKIEGWKEQNKTNQLKSEERKLSRQLKEKEEEIGLLENNIQLFNSSSNNAQKMVKEYQEKIENLKEEIGTIREKLDLIQE